jgi:hypothetical protein
MERYVGGVAKREVGIVGFKNKQNKTIDKLTLCDIMVLGVIF